jgi:hypothetical protein
MLLLMPLQLREFSCAWYQQGICLAYSNSALSKAKREELDTVEQIPPFKKLLLRNIIFASNAMSTLLPLQLERA